MTQATNLGDVLRRDGHPDAPVIIGVGLDGAETVLTRGGLDQMADAFARGLVARGFQRGDRIAILSANRPEFLAVMLGAMRAGVVPTPVNFKFPKPTIAHVVADCGARVVFCDAARRDQLDEGVEAVEFDSADFGDWLDAGPFDPSSRAPTRPR
ncbi:long-chain fatty acid--CoA ligase [Chenggangzhangella methanolivorans]|uniref:long-chain fatty acid--CoA ligase n=1 Tax=Chenggangzhangella methanolivorans TaxID=1437009 RepID=UPI0021BD2938|nr:long-chain fatty acid--CoA ligase [Chenggangzhangella methanolivorans]